MPEEEEFKSETIWRLLLTRVKLTSAMLMLYLLSIGPMFWTWYEAKNLSDGDFLSRIIVAFYEPLRLACQIPIVGKIINNYIIWWAV